MLSSASSGLAASRYKCARSLFSPSKLFSFGLPNKVAQQVVGAPASEASEPLAALRIMFLNSLAVHLCVSFMANLLSRAKKKLTGGYALAHAAVPALASGLTSAGNALPAYHSWARELQASGLSLSPRQCRIGAVISICTRISTELSNEPSRRVQHSPTRTEEAHDRNRLSPNGVGQS